MKKLISQKSVLLLTVLTIITFHACKKDNDLKVTITEISASHAKAGVVIGITGTGFESTVTGNTVSFNGKNAEVLEATATKLKVKVPANGTSGKIKVSNVNGTAESSTAFLFDPTADFTFTTEANLLPGEVKLNLISNALSTTEVKWLLGTSVSITSPNNASWWFRKSGELNVKMIAYSGAATDTIEKKIQLTTDNSMVAYYPLNADGTEELNRADGQRVNTESGTDRRGTVNSAIQFNGTNAFLKLPNGILKNAGGAITLSVWFQATDVSKAGGIFGYQNAEVGNTPDSFVPSMYIGTNKKMHAKFWFGTDPIITAEDMNTSWHHLVLTGDANNQVLYIDGASKGSMSNGVDIVHNMLYNQLGVVYGGGVWPSIPKPAWVWFKGQMDDLAIYKKKLTAAEVKAIYDFQKL